MESALLAPSGHNRQPWQFRLGADYVDILADRSRGLPVLDPIDRELTMSCGVALFYLRLAIRYRGRQDVVVMQPELLDKDWIARVYLGEPIPRTEEDAQLFEAIPQRHTNRLPFFSRPLPETLPAQLARAAGREGGWLQVVGAGSGLAATIRLIGEGVHALAGSAAFRDEMTEWSHSRLATDTDGTAHLSAEIRELLTHSGSLMTYVDGGTVLARQEQLFAAEAPLLVALGTPRDTHADWLIAGQSLARVLLLAAAHGVTATYLNQPIQVEHLRSLLKDTLGMRTQPQLLLALGYAPAVSPAPRRLMTDLLV